MSEFVTENARPADVAAEHSPFDLHGVPDKNIGVGELSAVQGAIWDEGFSYHYFPPSCIVRADRRVNDTITACLSEKDIPYLTGLVRTTDVPCRDIAQKL